MAHQHTGYLPAAGHDLLLPLYDPTLRLLIRKSGCARRIGTTSQLRQRRRVREGGLWRASHSTATGH